MASVNFLYRSTKDSAKIVLRFLHRTETGRDLQIDQRTNETVTKDFWSNVFKKKRITDPILINDKLTLEARLNFLTNHVLKSFEATPEERLNKEWLKRTISEYYEPTTNNKTIPLDLVNFFDYYIAVKENEITETTRKKLITIRNKMKRMEEETGKAILLNEIDENFRNEFDAFYSKHQYSDNTKQREFTFIKTVCKYAKFIGIDIHSQTFDLSFKRKQVSHVFLTFDELELIKKQSFEFDYLDNARDWLLISCYTGQRVSDFMRFNPLMIKEENGKKFLEFRQKKTKKDIAIPLLPQVQEVLNKRNGNFPRPISHQKYNQYIKEVCRISGIDKLSKGKKRICIINDPKKATMYDYRDVEGEYPKYELVSSHIGRRSFATNYYGKVPTTYLKAITGHSTEAMFLSYIKKTSKDLAKESFKYFDK